MKGKEVEDVLVEETVVVEKPREKTLAELAMDYEMDDALGIRFIEKPKQSPKQKSKESPKKKKKTKKARAVTPAASANTQPQLEETSTATNTEVEAALMEQTVVAEVKLSEGELKELTLAEAVSTITGPSTIIGPAKPHSLTQLIIPPTEETAQAPDKPATEEAVGHQVAAQPSVLSIEKALPTPDVSPANDEVVRPQIPQVNNAAESSVPTKPLPKTPPTEEAATSLVVPEEVAQQKEATPPPTTPQLSNATEAPVPTTPLLKNSPTEEVANTTPVSGEPTQPRKVAPRSTPRRSPRKRKTPDCAGDIPSGSNHSNVPDAEIFTGPIPRIKFIIKGQSAAATSPAKPEAAATATKPKSKSKSKPKGGSKAIISNPPAAEEPSGPKPKRSKTTTPKKVTPTVEGPIPTWRTATLAAAIASRSSPVPAPSTPTKKKSTPKPKRVVKSKIPVPDATVAAAVATAAEPVAPKKRGRAKTAAPDAAAAGPSKPKKMSAADAAGPSKSKRGVKAGAGAGGAK